MGDIYPNGTGFFSISKVKTPKVAAFDFYLNLPLERLRVRQQCPF